MTKSFRDLIVWQKSRDLAVLIYRLTESFPTAERYGLAGQMRRAVVSISSNIAEGYNRFHRAEQRQFWFIAYGSGSELESQIEIAKTLYPRADYRDAGVLLEEVMRILNTLIHQK